MINAFEILGIDSEEIKWQHWALCANMGHDDFFEGYESNAPVARAVDQACLSCPVMTQCLQWGIDNGEYGVWGGIYLSAGKVDKAKNSHKSPDIWEEIRKRIKNFNVKLK